MGAGEGLSSDKGVSLMVKVSALVITRNEEGNIRRCLKSLSWADEVILVDAESQDRTAQIAREYTQRVYSHKWDGFVAQRNWTLKQAQYQWVFFLDADEVISPQLREELETLKDKEMGDYSGFEIPRRAFYLGGWVNHCGWYPNYQLRFFDRKRGEWVEGMIHERVEVRGRVGRLKGEILHYPYPNLSFHLQRMDSYSSLRAEELYQKGRRSHFWDLLLRPIFKFLKMFFLRLGFLEGVRGFIISCFGAYYSFLGYAKLFEKERVPR